MRKCAKCGVEILDDGERCPLCQHVLEHTPEPPMQIMQDDNSHTTQSKAAAIADDGSRGADNAAETGESVSLPMNWLLDPAPYPNARIFVRRFRFLENLILFLSIVAECILIGVNVRFHPQFLYCIIVGLGLIYVNVLLRLAVIGRSGYRFKVVSMFLFAIVVLVAIDYLTGHRGWAVDYVLPGGILLLDIGILVLMIVDFGNWQSYMVGQLFSILLALVALVLVGIGVGSRILPAFIVLGASVFLFLGTLIIGDRRARNELLRRFHI